MKHFSRDIDENLLKQAMLLINQPILSVIYDQDCRIIACSNLAAISVGFKSWHQAIGISYQDTGDSNLMKMVFGRK